MGRPHARRKRSGNPILVFVLTFAFVGLPFLLVLIALIWKPASPPPSPWPTAVLTRHPPESPTPSSLPPEATTPPPSPSPQAAIRTGIRVVVSGTGGGLNLRGAPAIASPSEYLAQDGESFLVLQGPIENDDFRWWRLQKEDDPAIVGWAVEAYLRPVP